jgi:hypothetical protein
MIHTLLTSPTFATFLYTSLVYTALANPRSAATHP